MSDFVPARAGLLPRMAWLHTGVGLLAGWILYGVFLTGTLSYFRDEITTWMRPEARPASSALMEPAEFAQQAATAMDTQAPRAARWILELPTPRRPAPSAFWVGESTHGEIVFDGASARPVHVRDTAGGEFFYRFHYQLHYLPHPWGRWIVGLCSMAMLVGLVTGLIIHRKLFSEFFTFRWGRGPRGWLDAHNALSVFPLPFHLMIVYSGLVMLAFQYMPWGAIVAYEDPQQRRAALLAETDASVLSGPPRGVSAPLANLSPMLREAQWRWGQDGVGTVVVYHPGDGSARVLVARGPQGRISTRPQYLLFDGTDGTLVQVKDEGGAVAQTRGVLYGLHLGRFADTALRWLYALSGLAGTAMIGTGLVLWTAKRREQRRGKDRSVRRWQQMERITVAVIAGLSVAVATYFWLNRLLPVEWPQRREWEIQGFFLAWGLMVAHAFLRPAYRAWAEQWAMAGVMLLALAALSAWNPAWTGGLAWGAVEWVLCAIAGVHLLLAVHCARYRAHAGPAG